MAGSAHASSRGALALDAALAALPYRGVFGDRRPAALHSLALPPDPMPARQGARPLKAWRYIGFFAEEVMVCAATVRIGPVRDVFWALWDRRERRLRRGARLTGARVEFATGSARLRMRGLEVELSFSEEPGVETVCATGDSYAWTRKQGGVPALAKLDGRRHVWGRVIVDDTAAYFERHTRWRWAAGVGRSVDGEQLAWNLVSGVNDPELGSERSVWIDGVPREAPPSRFDDGGVDELRFAPEATLARRTNAGILRSDYVQPFGAFSGRLPGGVELAEGTGVMEVHDAWW